ncbi:MAG TPA: hypothetical protein VJ949_04365 [Cryomorphaceae bacterium]|nr:hypothetical protein [Cryomorphaceae bacterium]
MNTSPAKSNSIIHRDLTDIFQRTSSMKKFRAILGITISTIYLLNFTLGIWELPDNLPIIGHLDEFAAATLLIASLRYFDIDLTDFMKSKKKSSKTPESKD